MKGGHSADQHRRELCFYGALSTLVLILAASLFAGSLHDEERRRFVATVVFEQEGLLATSALRDRNGEALSLGPEQTLLEDLFESGNPATALKHVEALPFSKANSPVTQRRWREMLTEWRDYESASPAEGLTPDQILTKGRWVHFAADGYRNQGRAADAIPFYAWSAQLLARFLGVARTTADVPEALSLLGDSYFTMAHVAVGQGHDVNNASHWGGIIGHAPGFLNRAGQEVLRLCSELYPGSIWANRANALWRSEIGNGSE